MRLSVLKFCISVAAVLMVPNVSMAKAAGVCSIKNDRFTCGTSLRRGSAVLEAMANPESTEALRKAMLEYDFGTRRERYRRSVEANRRSMKRYADRQWRRYRRGRLSSEKYEAVRKKYAAGLATYRAALNVYRNGTWQSPVPPYQGD